MYYSHVIWMILIGTFYHYEDMDIHPDQYSHHLQGQAQVDICNQTMMDRCKYRYVQGDRSPLGPDQIDNED